MRILPERFQQMMKDSLDDLPLKFRQAIENVEFVIEDGEMKGGSHPYLGLYQGIPLPERGGGYSGVLPDKITIFKQAIESMGRTEEEVAQVLRETLIHEVGHYFGFSEQEIREAGY